MNSNRHVGLKRNNFEQNFSESSANFSQSNFNNQKMDNYNNNSQGQTIQLLSINQSGKVQLNNEAIDIIASYTDKPVGFVSVVGKYRTGKSYLLNKLLFLDNKGFKVQQYTTACTQGIWMWTNPFLNQQLGNYLFFVDTQGLSSMQKGQNNDVRVLTISALISSYLIYNSVGCIDERSISDLNSITKLSKNVIADNNLSDFQNEKRICEIMPKFCWVIRDFTLELQDARGRKINPKQYLQNSLKQDSTSLRGSDQSRRVKKSLLSYFQDRDCFTLVRPASDQRQIQSLNKLSDVSLRRQFIDGLNLLRQKIQKNAGCKKYNGKQLTGYQLACMIQSYVNSINSGAIPNIRTAWQQIADNQGDIAFSAAHQKYLQKFQFNFHNEQPKQEKELYSILSSMKQAAILQYRKNSSQQNQQHYNKLRDWIKGQQQAIIEANQNAISSKNLQILKQQSHDLMRKVQSNKYAGKKQEYLADLQRVLNSYRRNAIGDKKQALLSEFLETTNKISINLDKQPQNYEKNQYLAREVQQKIRIKQQLAKTKANQNAVASNIAKNEEKGKQKRDNLKRKSKNPQKVGCCGGKCQIM